MATVKLRYLPPWNPYAPQLDENYACENKTNPASWPANNDFHITYKFSDCLV